MYASSRENVAIYCVRWLGRQRDTRRLRRHLEAYTLSSAGVAQHKTIYDAAEVNKATPAAYDELFAAQLRPELQISATRPRLHHLRTKQGRHEIDLIAELTGQRVVGIEVKASSAPTRDDAKHLRWLRDELGERFLAGIVLHTGPRIRARRANHRSANRGFVGIAT